MAGRKLTDGEKVVRRLTRDLADGVVWTEAEKILLDHVRDAVDRIALLKPILAAEAGKPDVSTRRVAEIAAELRQLEANVVRWSSSLQTDVAPVKSARHVKAAHARWNRSA